MNTQDTIKKEEMILNWSEMLRYGQLDRWEFYALMSAFITINEWQGIEIDVDEENGVLLLIPGEIITEQICSN